MVDFGEALSYGVGVFSIIFAVILLAGYAGQIDALQATGIQIPVEIRTAVVLVYFVFGLLGSSQIWLGLLHRRVVDLENDLEVLSNDIKKNTKALNEALERMRKPSSS